MHVIDDHTIAVPERPGNRRADSFHNILANPHVGLIFLIPGRRETLRINGRVRIFSDAPWFDELVVEGHRPILALVVDIDTIYFHCQKAFMRSQLWKPETWTPEALPSHAKLIKSVQNTRGDGGGARGVLRRGPIPPRPLRLTLVDLGRSDWS